ncbi:cupredoxin domain-containing protein [Aldersonia kunmingensis]|uniref:cupredoxin domain-containing protein n=1 Tax=Aldersonia kunmingensis TaxID=408066 RepID=UPI000836B8D0|nr:plastocyanin/azurin family copper-binding protein [Aldersonia kunmingensis]
MHKRFRLIIAGIALVTAFSACSSEDSGDTASTTTPATAVDGSAVPTTAADAEAAAVVEVMDMSFKPATVTIEAGEAVTWEFDDGGIPHAVQGLNDNGMELSSPILKSGPYTHTFTAPGTYEYICPLHPQMKATVIVK